MQVIFYILIFILGAALGSFLCCQAQRLHIKETKKKSPGRRSACLHCGHKLKWYENIPVISWLIQKGKCKKCGKKIGMAELLSELGLAFSFLAIGTTINIATANAIEWSIFIVTLLLILSMGFLAIYDGKWGKLPVSILTLSIIFAIGICVLRWVNIFTVSIFTWEPVLCTFAAVVILGGLYLLLYLISKGKWVGDGDWIIGVIMGLALGTPWLALVALFIANFAACIVMYPLVRKKKTKKIHFAPFLFFALVVTLTVAEYLTNLVG